MSLPEERIPFPVEPRYSVRPTMQRWSPDDRGHLRMDARYPEYLDAKLALLAGDPDGCRVLAPGVDREELVRTLLRVAEGLARDAATSATTTTAANAAPDAATDTAPGATPGAPARPARRGDPDPTSGPPPLPVLVDAGAVRFPLLGFALEGPELDLVDEAPPASGGAVPPALRRRVRTHLSALEPLERLADALALAVQEDLVVMAGATGDARAGDHVPPRPGPTERSAPDARAPDAPTPRDGRAELLHVCFPSSWDPAARAGAGFAALHAPVPHSETLRAASGRVVRAMVAKGPFVRYVWSLAPDDALDRNPRRAPALPPVTDPARLWFRVERQTVMPLPVSGRALFTIRVYRAPLPEVLDTPDRRRTLASALRSMDAALLAYKGVGGLREPLLAYLDGPPAT